MDDFPEEVRPEAYLIPIVFACFFIIGAIANGTLVRIFICHKNMRTISNTYIMNLAVSSLLVIALCIPFLSTLYTVRTWVFGTFVCKAVASMSSMLVAVSAFTLAAFSAHRYYVTANSTRQMSTKKVTLLIILGIWILAFIISLPEAILSTVIEIDIRGGIKVCSLLPEEFEYVGTYLKVRSLFNLLACFAIPLCIVVAYFVASYIKRRTRTTTEDTQSQSSENIEVDKMLFTFVITHILCHILHHILETWIAFHTGFFYDVWYPMILVAFCLDHLIFCINPIIVYFLSRTYRKHFDKYLFSYCIRSRENEFHNEEESAPIFDDIPHSLVEINTGA